MSTELPIASTVMRTLLSVVTYELCAQSGDLNGNTGSFRLSQANAFIEAMNQTMQNTVLNGDTDVTPEGFLGLSKRFNAAPTNSTGAATKVNVIDAGGTTNLTSVWLIGWGENSVHGIYPKGSQAGLTHEDLGKLDAFDAANNRFRAYGDPVFSIPTANGTIKVQSSSAVITTDASGNATITYPSAFTQGVLTVIAMNGDYSNGGDVVVSLRNWNAATLTTFDVHLSNSVSSARRVNYIAIGI